MTPSELQLENDALKQQLVVALAAIADRDAALADRDVKIKKLAHDLATLEAAVKRLLEVDRYPTASFVITSPVALPSEDALRAGATVPTAGWDGAAGAAS